MRQTLQCLTSNLRLIGGRYWARCLTFGLALILLFVPWSGRAQSAETTASAPMRDRADITLGAAVAALHGPWKFHTGDDERWAVADFDDAAWETVDLTPTAGAHDADVGLSGYVAGWAQKGHPGYSGYAWYRMRVTVSASAAFALAVAGPPDVDDAYQIFVDGRLVGADGDFSGRVPTVYSIQPRIFPLPAEVTAMLAQKKDVVIAFRVWMAADSLAGNPDGGGIHIAPAIGEAGAIHARYLVQWEETIRGYIVDAVEPFFFFVLAMLALRLMACEPEEAAHKWIAAALVCTALVRVQQVVFFWTQSESIRVFALVKEVTLVPLSLAAWTMAWRAWFGVKRPAWIPRAVAILTVAFISAQLLLWLDEPHAVTSSLEYVSSAARIGYAGLFALIVFEAARELGRRAWMGIVAMLLVATGLFAQELSALHVPSIWFPFDTGVSRTQFAYAAFIVLFFVLLLARFGRIPRLEVRALA